MPLFSIITVNLNNFLGLRETIQSVLIQEFENFEIIIIDGNSNDGICGRLTGSWFNLRN